MSQLKAQNFKSLLLKAKEKGQVAVEYILLLVVAVTVALIIVVGMVSRVEGEEGFLIEAWQSLLVTMGSDYADDVPPPPEE